MKILVIPDTQIKPGVPTEHLLWAGRACVEYKPDVIVHLGDHWDFVSLNSYLPPLEIESTRLLADIDSGNQALELFQQPIKDYNKGRRKKYKPQLHLLRGNHEQRLQRYISDHPALEALIGFHLLKSDGWTVHPFLEVVEIAGIHFSHYFYSPNTGRPLCGTAHSKLKNVGLSFVMGHQQGKDLAERSLPNGQKQRALIVGSFYLHNESYRGPQGYESWRGVVVLNDAKNGSYDLMELGIDYLKRKFA